MEGFGNNYSFKKENIKILSYKEEKKEDIKVNKNIILKQTSLN